MKDEVLKEIKGELNFRERIIFKILRKYSYKIYFITRKRIFNNIFVK